MKFIKNRRGETIVTTLVLVVTVFTLIATFITMFPLFIIKTKVDAMARQLVRVIELTGEIGVQYEAELADLCASSSFDPTVTVIPMKSQYQLREQFSVEVTVPAQIKVFTPSAGVPVGISVQISSTSTGRSEVYFKP